MDSHINVSHLSGHSVELCRMELIINSEPATFEKKLTIEQLVLYQFKELPKGIAIAVNQEVVPRDEWKTFQLSNGSNILIIKATQGG